MSSDGPVGRVAELLDSGPATDATGLGIRFPDRGHTVVARPNGVAVQ